MNKATVGKPSPRKGYFTVRRPGTKPGPSDAKVTEYDAELKLGASVVTTTDNYIQVTDKKRKSIAR